MKLGFFIGGKDKMSGTQPETIDGHMFEIPKELYRRVEDMIETGKREDKQIYFDSALMIINDYFQSKRSRLHFAREMASNPNYGSHPLPGNDEATLDLEEALIAKYEPIVLKAYETVIQSMQLIKEIQIT